MGTLKIIYFQLPATAGLPTARSGCPGCPSNLSLNASRDGGIFSGQPVPEPVHIHSEKNFPLTFNVNLPS